MFTTADKFNVSSQQHGKIFNSSVIFSVSTIFFPARIVVFFTNEGDRKNITMKFIAGEIIAEYYQSFPWDCDIF